MRKAPFFLLKIGGSDKKIYFDNQNCNKSIEMLQFIGVYY